MNESLDKKRDMDSNDNQGAKGLKRFVKEKDENLPDSKAIAKERLQNTKLRAIKHRLENGNISTGIFVNNSRSGFELFTKV